MMTKPMTARPEAAKSLPGWILHYWLHWVLGILYTVGLAGFIWAKELGFPYLTPVNLLLTAVVLILLSPRSPKVWGWFALVGLGGWLAEAVGTNTGLLFGEYAYGPVLGPKLLGVPLILAGNWLIVVYAIAGTLEQTRFPNWAFALTGAAIATLLDALIEPVAIAYDFWDWAGAHIPAYNYVCWFALSWLFLAVFQWLNIRLSNSLSFFVLVLQFLFFSLLNLALWIF